MVWEEWIIEGTLLFVIQPILINFDRTQCWRKHSRVTRPHILSEWSLVSQATSEVGTLSLLLRNQEEFQLFSGNKKSIVKSGRHSDCLSKCFVDSKKRILIFEGCYNNSGCQ